MDKGARPSGFWGGLLVFVPMALVLVFLLAGIGALPLFVDDGLLRQFRSVEEAERVLGPSAIRLPAYFPEGIKWPPISIIGQREPHPASAVIFASAEGEGGPALQIVKAKMASDTGRFGWMRVSEVTEEVATTLKGRPVTMQNGRCPDGRQCSRILWQEPEAALDITMAAQPADLVRIVESMVAPE